MCSFVVLAEYLSKVLVRIFSFEYRLSFCLKESANLAINMDRFGVIKVMLMTEINL
jgi:hypothetical protein